MQVGRVPERLKGTVLKTVKGEISSRVRISPLPTCIYRVPSPRLVGLGPRISPPPFMKKLILIIIAIIVIALLIWLGINLFKIKPIEQNNSPQNNEPAQETEPTAKETTIAETTDEYKISVKYPEIRGTANSQSQSEANTLIKKITDAGIESFKDDVEKNAVEDFSLTSTLTMDYEVLYLTDITVSIKFNISYYIAGMTHTTNYSSGFNYNLKNNKSITLGDLFNPNADFLSSLSTACEKDLKTQLSPNYYNEQTVKSGLEPKEENFAEFVFDRTELTMIFNIYQVASYAAGTRLVKILYTKLSAINSNSELLKLIK